jgi:hypothetical protein
MKYGSALFNIQIVPSLAVVASAMRLITSDVPMISSRSSDTRSTRNSPVSSFLSPAHAIVAMKASDTSERIAFRNVTAGFAGCPARALCRLRSD